MTFHNNRLFCFLLLWLWNKWTRVDESPKVSGHLFLQSAQNTICNFASLFKCSNPKWNKSRKKIAAFVIMKLHNLSFYISIELRSPQSVAIGIVRISHLYAYFPSVVNHLIRMFNNMRGGSFFNFTTICCRLIFSLKEFNSDCALSNPGIPKRSSFSHPSFSKTINM